MVYAKKRKSGTARKGVKKSMYKRKSSSALSIAKKALQLAKQTTNATVETKYLSRAEVTDLVNNGSGVWGAAMFRELTGLNGTTPLFNSDPVTGNKVYFKGCKVTWEIHMDNLNSEEETCNFTVAVIQPRADLDLEFAAGSGADYISTIQGQTYFDPRMWKIHYYRHFVRTQGGTSPGTAGESTKSGYCYVPINKMVRLGLRQGQPGAQNVGQPASNQDRFYFVVFTDNQITDLEAPRMNWRTMLICKDLDVNS